MVDHACDDVMMQQIRDTIMQNIHVLGIDELKTRVFGNRVYVDIEISVDGKSTLQAAHDTAHCVQESIQKKFSKVKHVMVHVNPAD